MRKIGLLGLIIPILLFVSCKQEVYFTISTKVQPDDGGSIIVTPSSGTVLEQTSVTFMANPNNEFVFTGWSGDLSGTENPKTVIASSNLNVVANFTLKSYQLSLSVEGDGAINEQVISAKTDYSSGTVVELTAKPAEHWLFDHWEGDLSENKNPAQITVSSAKSVKAVFVKKMYDLTVEVIGEGAVSEKVVETKSGSYQEGTVVELTAQPSEHWLFDHWEGDLTGNKNPAQITVASAKSVKAVFVTKMYDLTIEVQGEGAVSEKVVETKSGSYQEGTIVELTAKPSEHWAFDHWEGDLVGKGNPAKISISSAQKVKAVFVEKMYPLTVEVQGGGAVREELIETKSVSYQEGSVVQLTGIPNSYWIFDHWEGAIDSKDNPISITIVDSTTIIAVFVENDPGIVFTETEYISPYEINNRMKLGWNVACQMEAFRKKGDKIVLDETSWGNPKCTQELFSKVAAAGFKSVRIPVTWTGGFGPAPDYKINEERLDRLSEIIGYAENAGMVAIINMHGDNAPPEPNVDDSFWINPSRAAKDPSFNKEVKARIKALWIQIARRFRDKGDFLMFEAFNEPGGDEFYWSWPTESEQMAHSAEYECLNEWNQIFVDAVRSTGGNNAKRWLIVTGGGAKERHLNMFKLPHDYVSNNRLMISVHVYEPESYVFGTVEEWGHTAQIESEDIWNFDEQFISNEFTKFKEKYLNNGIPLFVGEVGCYNRDNERGKAFQLYYLEYFFRAAALNGLAPFIWDDGGREGAKRGEFIFWHGTGEYFDYGEEIVSTIRNAIYSEDPTYTLQSIYDRAPFIDPDSQTAVCIPDAEFKRYLIKKYDVNGDGEINKDEIWRVTEIDIDTKNVHSMEGLEHFINLQTLRCRGREEWVADDYGPGLLTELDVSHNPLLKTLEINNNHITSLDLSNNHELEGLCVRSNELSSIDLTHCPNLLWFDASINLLSNIDFSNNHNLRHIYLRGNSLNNLSVAHLTSLNDLNFGQNHIKTIDLNNNVFIQSLEADSNLLEYLDVSYLPSLRFLRCNGNPSLKTVWVDEKQSITELYKDDFTELIPITTRDFPDPVFRKYVMDNFDFNKDNHISDEEAALVIDINVNTDRIFSLKGIDRFVNLERLICEGSYTEEYASDGHHGVLSELNVSNNKNLIILQCGYNQLETLDVSHNTLLKILYCQNNPITQIDISNNPLLEDLCIRYCHITLLDLSNNKALYGVDCQGGQGYNLIKNIDVSNCPYISVLNCNSVGLDTLDVSHNPSLNWLGIVDSNFTSIDLSQNTELKCLYADDVSLYELDLTPISALEYLFIRDSPSLKKVYLRTDQTIDYVYKDDHTVFVYK